MKDSEKIYQAYSNIILKNFDTGLIDMHASKEDFELIVENPELLKKIIISARNLEGHSILNKVNFHNIQLTQDTISIILNYSNNFSDIEEVVKNNKETLDYIVNNKDMFLKIQKNTNGKLSNKINYLLQDFMMKDIDKISKKIMNWAKEIPEWFKYEDFTFNLMNESEEDLIKFINNSPLKMVYKIPVEKMTSELLNKILDHKSLNIVAQDKNDFAFYEYIKMFKSVMNDKVKNKLLDRGQNYIFDLSVDEFSLCLKNRNKLIKYSSSCSREDNVKWLLDINEKDFTLEKIKICFVEYKYFLLQPGASFRVDIAYEDYIAIYNFLYKVSNKNSVIKEKIESEKCLLSMQNKENLSINFPLEWIINKINKDEFKLTMYNAFKTEGIDKIIKDLDLIIYTEKIDKQIVDIVGENINIKKNKI